jgi:hypothetical protein
MYSMTTFCAEVILCTRACYGVVTWVDVAKVRIVLATTKRAVAMAVLAGQKAAREVAEYVHPNSARY